MLNSKTERNVIKENLKQKSYEIKKDDLRKTLGNAVVNRVESSSCNDWLDDVNRCNKETYEKHKEKLAMGIERKISLHWFRLFFNKDGYKVDMNTPRVFASKVSRFNRFNWLDVPFPQADKIQIGIEQSEIYGYHYEDLPERSYNWYELFLLIDKLMWRQGRCIDIAITSLNSYLNESTGEKTIVIEWSS